MSNKSMVTITRRSTVKGDDCISINITDESSGLIVTEVEMSLQDFTEALTGLARCDAEFKFMPKQHTIDHIGKKREVRYIYVDSPTAYKRSEIEKQVAKSIVDSGELKEGWGVFDDGTRSQQPGEKHRATLIRFVEAKS